MWVPALTVVNSAGLAPLAYFVWVTRRVKSMWVAQCLGQIFIILMSQLTSYYYAFMIISAPLTKARRQLEIPIVGLAAVSPRESR